MQQVNFIDSVVGSIYNLVNQTLFSNNIYNRLNQFFENKGFIKYENNKVKQKPKIKQIKKTEYGYHIILQLFPGLSIIDLYKNSFTLEYALFGECNIYQDDFYNIHIKVYNRFLPEKFNYVSELAEKVKNYPIAIPAGISRQGLVLIKLFKDDEFGVLVAGSPGTGKSEFLRQAIHTIVANYKPEDVNLYMIDMKTGVTLSQFKNYLHCKTYTENIEEIPFILNNIITEINNRATLFKQANVTNINTYNDIFPGCKIPHSVFIIDEYADLENKDKLIIADIVRKARSFGIHPIICTQKENLHPSAKGLLPVIVCFRVQTKAMSKQILGDENEMAVYLKYQGRAILQKNNYMRQIQVMHLENNK